MEQNGIGLSEILLASMIGLFALAMGIVLIFVIHQRRMVAKDLQQKQLEHHYQKQLLKATIESQEKERNRIAHDLHDEIGVLLTTSRLYFNQLSYVKAEEHLQQVSNKMNGLFDEMMFNIRRISHDLRPVILENLGLIEAVESLSEKLNEAGIQFQFTHQITIELSKEAELILYRIIQELIGNTLKHAKASHIFLHIKDQQHQLYLTYKDDGIGFEPDNTNSGLGMKSIESRLNLLDGKMKIIKPEKGIHLLMEMDIHKFISHEL
ncbi:sensor histidine kinase [Xanthocytophaga agilis]|uniref:histidine kinase n=1 Tax=Xanthocytophaga agilis TaxID=3048010 RepID=A0AAE3RDD0_9BACT|nr:ATP-binding protein [Xanthocytophaga agilis]MDJ1506577.1 histidine kinase [Xanthocytophaga agilis]